MVTAGYNATGKFSSSLNAGRGDGPINFVPVGSFTVECWVKTAAQTTLQVAFGQSGAFWMGISAANQAVANYGSGGTAVALATAVVIGDSVWHHLELVIDSAAGGKLFVDGVLASSSATTPATSVMLTTGTINVRQNFGGGAGFNFVGEVDEHVVWSIARHSGAFTPPVAAYVGNEAYLLALWHLDGNGTNSANYTTITAVDPIGGQNIMVLVPGTYSAATPTNIILYCHGAGEDQTALITDTLKFACRDSLIAAGYILAGSVAGGANVWGNQTAVDAYAALDKYIRNNYNVRAVAVWSQSMGGMGGLQTISQNKVDACGWLGTYPVCNLANLYSLSVYTADINTTFGITGVGNATYSNKTHGADPVLKPARAYKKIPFRFYASAGDTTVPKVNNTDQLQAIVLASKQEAVTVVCTGNHGDPSHFVPSEYLAFFQRCFASAIPATRTVSLTLTTDGLTVASNLTGLRWAFYEEITPDIALQPVSKGSGATTSSLGVFSVTVSTYLDIGAVGWIIVTDSNGTVSFPQKVFSGPVTLS